MLIKLGQLLTKFGVEEKAPQMEVSYSPTTAATKVVLQSLKFCAHIKPEKRDPIKVIEILGTA